MPGLDAVTSALPQLDYDPTIPELQAAACGGKHDENEACASCPASSKKKETSASCPSKKETSASCPSNKKSVAAAVARGKMDYDPFDLPATRAAASAFSPLDLENINASARAIRASEKLPTTRHATPEKVAAVRLRLKKHAKQQEKEAAAAAARRKKEKSFTTPEKVAAVRRILDKQAAADAAADANAKAVIARARQLYAEYTAPEKVAAVRMILDEQAAAAEATTAKTAPRAQGRAAPNSGVDLSHLIQ